MVKTKSEQFFNNQQNLPPKVSPSMYKNVSQYRREQLEKETEQGLFRDGSSPPSTGKNALTPASFVTASVGLKKNAQVLSSANPATSFRGPGDTVRQSPEVYSPLWLNSNLNLPRDRATINAWCRSFYALQPFVHNAINLHSTYPISKLNIKCPSKKVEKFFNEMIENIDLMNVCAQAAQEFWLLGEAFIYAELNERKAMWSRLVIQNPDYMVIKRSVIASEPLIMMRPDESLRRIVFSNRPADIEQRRSLNETIVEHIKRGENIPMDNFFISHLARKISPYEVRGTGLPVSCFRQLMLFDLLRECHDEETEVLTDQGFKKIQDLLITSQNLTPKPEGISGVLTSEKGVDSYLTLKDNIKVACVNPQNNNIEYHPPVDLHMSYYEGDMHHYKGNKADIMITPNHKMWIKEGFQKNKKNVYGERVLMPSQQVLSKKKWYKLQSFANWQGKHIDTVNVIGTDIPAELYMKFLGYIVSEGCVYTNYKNGRYDALIEVSQNTTSDCYDDIRYSINKLAELLNKNCINYIRPAKKELNYQEAWSGRINGKDLTAFFKNEISTNVNEKCNAYSKRIPRWALELDKPLLSILLNSLVKGDGTETTSKYGTNSKGYSYCTVSKQLADDVYELVYKCGYVPSITTHNRKERNEYYITWSNTNYGNEPCLYTGNRHNWTPNTGGGINVEIKSYKGIVWCFETKTGLFITRRNGKITVQGNSKFAQASSMINPLTLCKVGTDGVDGLHPTQADLESFREALESAQYDRDFKLITHAGVSIERIGYAQGIYDISGDITQLLKEIYMGLMVPQIILEGGGDVTYANGGISLDVLRQRYMQFRNMMGAWLRKKIFAPIAKLNEFYDYQDGEKQLILPEVDWNHMSLFDTADYVNVLVQLSGDQKKVSQQTLYKSLGLEFDNERINIKKEDISDAIRKKELMSLDRLALNELRSLTSDSEIPEITEPANPNQSPYTQSSTPGMDQGGGPPGGLSLPPLPGVGGPPSGGLGPEIGPPPTGGPPGGGAPPAA
jgi:hypothetical protein